MTAEPRAAAQSGFSLVEVLVTLVVAGIVAGAVVAVLLAQGRSYAVSADRTHAQQSLRAAADLVSTELGSARPGDLAAATADSVVVRHDVLRAVVCSSDGAGGGSATLFVYDSVDGPNLPANFRGYAFSDPGSRDWVRAEWGDRSSSPLAVETGTGRLACESRGAPAGRAGWRYRTVTGWLLPGGFDSVPAPGAVVSRYGRLAYRLRPSSFDEAGVAVWRNRQEMVSPFGAGARLGYRTEDGTVRSSVPAAELGTVRAVRVTGTALGPGSNRHGVGRELRTTVRLQSGKGGTS